MPRRTAPAEQADLRLSPRIKTYLVRSGPDALCYIGAVNSTRARQISHMRALQRGYALKAAGTSGWAALQTFEPIRAVPVGTPAFDLADGEVIDLRDAEQVRQWWPTLHRARLAVGTPARPTFSHQPTPTGRI